MLNKQPLTKSDAFHLKLVAPGGCYLHCVHAHKHTNTTFTHTRKRWQAYRPTNFTFTFLHAYVYYNKDYICLPFVQQLICQSAGKQDIDGFLYGPCYGPHKVLFMVKPIMLRSYSFRGFQRRVNHQIYGCIIFLNIIRQISIVFCISNV